MDATRSAELCMRSRPSCAMGSAGVSAANLTCPAPLTTSVATATWPHWGGTPSDVKPNDEQTRSCLGQSGAMHPRTHAC